MIDKIKSNLTNSYMMFVFEFADPSTIDKSEIQAFIKCPLVDAFSSQRTADSAKKNLGKLGFSKLLSVYFGEFQTSDGIDFRRLGLELTKNKKVLLRHLGKDKVNFLNLLVSIAKSLESERKGLLFGEAS